VKLVLVHARAATVELLRYPSFSIPTLALPAIFFAFFALPRAHGRADVLLASFAGYAVLSVAFFQFGVAIAAERTRPWESYVRTLPVGLATRMAARTLSAFAFATASVAAVVAVALPTTSPGLGSSEWLRLVVALALGSVPFTLLGIALGYWLPVKGALPVANILYLALSYAGGLWTGPSGLPQAVTWTARVLPTRQWGEVLWPAAQGESWTASHWLALLGYALAFAALAAWGYRRDEGRRYR
jgi:ABC-2 type transport system permease protein